MLNIVVPMAGRGQRFREAGYQLPKPLVPVHGVPMIRLVIGNLRPARPHRFIFLVLEEHLAQHGVAQKLREWAPGAELVPVPGVTQGAACTVLLAERYIDGAQPLMIANSDQWIEGSIDDYLLAMDDSGTDGFLMTMTASDPKWSYVGFGADGKIDRVVEKQVISDQATVGVYNFREGRRFVAAARRMIEKNLMVNGEFYVAPVYNQLLAEGARVGSFDVGTVGRGMHGLGTPADLARFLELDLSRRAAAAAEAGG